MYGGRTFGVLDMIRCAGVIDVKQRRLIAITVFRAEGPHTFLLGWRNIGKVLGPEGRELKCNDVPELVRRWKIPVIFPDADNQVILECQVNIHQREPFPFEVRNLFRDERMVHCLQLYYSYPNGDYIQSRLELREPGTAKQEYFYELPCFPFDWPAPQASLGEGVKPAEAPRGKPNGNGGAAPGNGQPDTPSWLHAPAAGTQEDAPETTHLPMPELLELLEYEEDPTRRWRIVEANLKLGRPERSYQLVRVYAELIAARTGDWPPARLKTALGGLPGSVLVNLMGEWRVNQVLAVAEGNAESERIIKWLREREIDRLLDIDPRGELMTAEQARTALRVAHYADEKSIRKTWRMLAHFLNADHGRSEERAIHRKKDEIIKHLQEARDLLMRTVGRPG